MRIFGRAAPATRYALRWFWSDPRGSRSVGSTWRRCHRPCTWRQLPIHSHAGLLQNAAQSCKRSASASL